jgi:signal transduction histidine kinase
MATEPAANPADIGKEIAARREALAEAVTDRQYHLHPDLAGRFGPLGRQRCREDAAFHLSYLAEAVAVGQPALFADYLAWAKVMLAGRGIPADDLVENLRALTDVLSRELPGGMAAVVSGVVEAGLAALPGVPAVPPAELGEGPLAGLARRYLHLLLAGNRQEASRLILEAAEAGTAVRDLYLEVFEPCQHEIGRLWQINRISVAQEHFCTAATQLVMSQLYSYIFSEKKNGRTLVAACVEGDLHEIGVRMVADFFELSGWNTVYLGASTPTASLVKVLVERKADVLAVSASLTAHLGAVVRLIAAIRGSEAGARVKILVGGHPFLVAPDLWRQVGADGCAGNARSAVEEAERLFGSEGLQASISLAAPAVDLPPAARYLERGERGERGEREPPGGTDAFHYEEMSRLNNELITAQRELAKQNVLLERANEEKSQLLGIAAHDLRNPLEVIQIYSRFLREEAEGRLGREPTEFIRTIERSSEFMAKLVDDLLDLSQIESGRLVLDLAPVDLPALVARNVQLNRVLAAKRRVAIAFTSEGKGAPLLLDAAKIEQVLNNLIGNAVKFSPPGSTVQVRLTLVSDRGNGTGADLGAELTVADQGPGIPEAERARIFLPLAPDRPSGRPAGSPDKRTGLGLAIVQRIVAGHRGDLRVECGKRGGTTFAVTLPRLAL